MKNFISIMTTAAAAAALSVFSIFFLSWAATRYQRWTYSRRTHPRNIEKNAQDELERELQQFLLEEEIKEKARRRQEHPSSYSKTVGGLDGSTKEILAKMTKPSRNDRNNQFWWGE